jgi:AraC-like DNA-binding protein
MAGDVRACAFGARIPSNCRWLPYDSLEILPYLIEAEPAISAVVVDLVRWAPAKAAPDLSALRRMWSDLRIVCLYEPGPDTLAQLRSLAELDLDLAFAVNPDERFDLLVKPMTSPRAAEEPTAGRMLLESLMPFATGGVLESALTHLALAPSLHPTVPDLARIAGCSVDALERRFAQAGMATPAAIRGLAATAEGLWQFAARNHSAREAALAVGLSSGDALGRMLKRWFGLGLRRARLVGASGARDAFRWTGLLGLRGLAGNGGLPALANLQLALRAGGQVGGDGMLEASEETCGAQRVQRGIDVLRWSFVAGGVSLDEAVQRLVQNAPGERLRPAVALGLGRALLRQEVLARPQIS